MRCLVTGASGHLGSYLTRLLLSRGHEVAILVQPQSDLWRITEVLSEMKLIYGDLSEMDRVRIEIISLKPHIVFHLAWYGVTNEYRNDPNQINYNLIGSLRLFQFVMESGCLCWVGIGSQAEYGPYNGILQESLPTRPTTVYGTTKLCTGLLSRHLCEIAGMRFLWFRLLATYGPKDDVHHLIPTVILKLQAHERPALTQCEQRWDYLFIEDAAEAIYQAGVNSKAQGVFNLGSGQAHSLRNIVEQIRDLIDPHLPLGFGELLYRSDQPMHLQADIERFKQMMGWSPKVSLSDGLLRTVEWYRGYGDRFCS